MHVVFGIGKWYTFLHICWAFNAETIQFPRGMKNILTVFFSMMKWFAAWRCNILARMNLYPLVMKTDGWKWHQIMKGRARQAQAVKKDHLTRPKAFSNHLGVYVSIVGIFINVSGHGYLKQHIWNIVFISSSQFIVCRAIKLWFSPKCCPYMEMVAYDIHAAMLYLIWQLVYWSS